MASSSSNVPTFEQFFTLPTEAEFTAIALEGANVEGINEVYRNAIIKIAYNISKFTTMRLFETMHESFVQFNDRLRTAKDNALDSNMEERKLNPKSSSYSKPEERKKEAPKPGASSSKFKKI